MESKKHDPFLGKYIYVTKYVVKFMPEDAFWDKVEVKVVPYEVYLINIS
jgi:hypothetical protein